LWFTVPVSHLCAVILLQYVSEKVSHTLHEHYYVHMHVCLTLLVHVVQSMSSCRNAKDCECTECAMSISRNFWSMF